MSVKEAFDIYFEKRAKRIELLRKVPYNKNTCPPELILPESLDKDGYAEWIPKLQDKPVDFGKAEAELGFAVSPQIKEYVSSYWFLDLDGRFESEHGTVSLCLKMITPYTDIVKFLTEYFNYEDTNCPKEHDLLMIGSFCCINGDDGYLIMADNDTDEVTAVQPLDKRSVHLADSIEELLKKMDM